MGIKQFATSIRLIVTNPYVNRGEALARHLVWQVKKAFNLFPFKQTLSKSTIVAPDKTCGVSALIWSQGMYDYNNMHLIQLMLKDGGTFFDIGANIGSFTLIASEQGAARIHAFEPHPATFRRLKENVEANSQDNVFLHNIALGDAESTVLLTDKAGSAINHIVSAENQVAETLVVKCRRIDTICEELAVVPEYVKLDVEGFEYDVLRGFGQMLSSVKVLMVEMNGLSDERSHGQKEVHTLLTSAGLSGPGECYFDERLLVPLARQGREDVLYVSSSFRNTLTALGFKFSNSH